MKSSMHLTSIILLASLTQVITAEGLATFGELCNANVPCDSGASLICINKKCQCSKSEEFLTSNSTFAKCVALANQRCLHTSSESPGVFRIRRVQCIEHAECNPDGICECQKNFHNNTKGRCVPIPKGYGGSCGNDLECREDLNLICSGGKCICNETEAIYDRILGRCAGKAGTYFWNRTTICVNNAYLSNYSGNAIVYRCECGYGYLKTGDGLCLSNYGSYCDPLYNSCHEDYACNGGKCTCHFPNYQEINYTSWKCRSNLNGPCLETKRGKLIRYECSTLGAECRNDNGVYECLCKRGYKKSEDNKCLKAFGVKCTRDEECFRVPGTQLLCKEGTCSCDDFQVYDQELEKCFGVVGAKCSEEMGCIENAHCEMQRTNSPISASGICKCNVGTRADFRRRCV